MAHKSTPSQADAWPLSSRLPSPIAKQSKEDGFVSLRSMKALAERFEPTHPFRILLLGEPDRIPRDEYATKVVGWYRLIVSRAGSVRLDDR
jgi:hypothetical protein